MAWSKDAYTTDTPSADLSDKLKDLCGSSGVKNWSFVENVPAGTGDGQSGSNNYSVDVNLTSRIAILQRNAPAADTWPSGVGCIRGLLKEDVLALYLPSPNVWDTTTVGAQSDWTVIVGGGYCYLGAGISSYSTITRAV